MRFRLTLVFFAAVLAAGCGDAGEASNPQGDTKSAGTTSSTIGGETPPFAEADADSVLEYKLIDYAFDGPTTAKATKVFFEAENSGSEDHELEVLDGNGSPLGEIEAMPPGAKGSAALELPAGTYTLQCILETKDGKVHRDLGMVAKLEVS